MLIIRSQEIINIYSLLLVAGYLKALQKELQSDGVYLCEVSIPNKEIAAVYKKEKGNADKYDQL